MATPTSPPNSKDPSHLELVEPESQPNKSKLAEEELRKEAEQRFRHDYDELEEMEVLLPSVIFPDRQIQIEELRKEAQQFETDFTDLEMKIHRFPASLQGIDLRYILPKVVSIGLYHHNSSNLQEMEKVKRAAAHHFISESGHTFDEMYAAVFSVIGTARHFYNAKVDVGDAEFTNIMFIDGCFLLQYMLVVTDPHKMPPSLLSCFRANLTLINNDIMLLENQLPWLVVDILRRFTFVPVEEFIRILRRSLQFRLDMDTEWDVLDGSYMPPHLLGILWFYKTGNINSRILVSNQGGFSLFSKKTNAMELEEIGIKLTANKTTKFGDMGVKRGFLSSEIFLAPLLLDDTSSCWLINMVAYEENVCMVPWDRSGTNQIKAVVCSYISVLAMLMDRVEDVNELRSKGLVQGELTNKDTLYFFKMLDKRLTDGPLYNHIMAEVEAYKVNRWIWIKVHRFVYKNFKAIANVISIVKVFSFIGVLVGIFKTLIDLKKK